MYKCVEYLNIIILNLAYPLSLRLRAISAVVWLLPAPNENRSREFVDSFVDSCAALNITPEEVTLILNVINTRVSITPSLAGMGIQIAGEWFKKDSTALQPEAMISLWDSSCKAAPQPILEVYLYYYYY